MSKELTGKVALITGGSRGIGAATARQLADQGANVVISYSSSTTQADAVVKELKAKGVEAAAIKADQANPKEVEGLISSVVKQFGHLDILVNNAAVFETGGLGDPATNVEKLDRQWAINVGGLVAAVRAAAPHLKAGARIISVGSGLGARVPFQGVADYSATKGAVALYTKGWARDLGPKGITVNAVQPGPIDTEMNPDSGAFADIQKSVTALGRYGKPEEVAAAIVFLASPAASYITGAIVDVDGGFNA